MSEHLLKAIHLTMRQQMRNQMEANADVISALKTGVNVTAAKLAAIEARAVVIETLTQILIEADALKNNEV